jgi:hypothetical protein
MMTGTSTGARKSSFLKHSIKYVSFPTNASTTSEISMKFVAKTCSPRMSNASKRDSNAKARPKKLQGTITCH